MKPLIEAKNLQKSFISPEKITVLSGVSLQIYPKTSTAIMGASGEGKTTLLYILGALESPDSGQLNYFSKAFKDWNLEDLRNKHIGFIFQSYNLLDDFTVLENVLMPAIIARSSTEQSSPIYKRALSLLDRIGLKKRAHFKTKQLSGGEKQRVSIARALLHNPDLILADEPTGNLDHKNSEEIHKILFECVRELGKSLVIVTHDTELAKLCDNQLSLSEGVLSPL